MSRSLLEKLTRYRSLAIALANAALTWTILIIAPLGLFAVIVCTVLVFASSLVLGVLGDLALSLLLREDESAGAMSGDRRVSIDPDSQLEAPRRDRDDGLR